jgi:hypothetical protein
VKSAWVDFRVAEQDRRVPSPQAAVYAEVEVCNAGYKTRDIESVAGRWGSTSKVHAGALRGFLRRAGYL